MSRFCWEENEGTIPPALWWNAITRALNGQRGQAALAELEAALWALPKRRLIENDISDGRDVCALGALALKREREEYPNETIQEILGDLERSYANDGELAVLECGEFRLGLKPTVAWVFSYHNDETFAGNSPEARWTHMMNWCREMQGKPKIKHRDPAPA